MPDSLRPELDLLLPAKVVDRLERILKPVSPTARHAVVGLAPAELIHEPPAPRPPVGQHQVHHVKIPLALVGVRLNVQEVGSVGRQHRLDAGGHRAEPRHVLFGRHRLEPTRWVVLALRGVRRRCDRHVRTGARHQLLDDGDVPAVAADQTVTSDQPHIPGHRNRLRGRFGNRFFLDSGGGLRFGAAKQHDEFLVGEPHQRQVEAIRPERLQYAPQQFIVPPGVEGELVIGDYQRTALRRREVRQHDHRHLGHLQLLAARRRAWPAMMVPSPSTRIGEVQPNSTMLAATCATCSSECVREFRAHGSRLSSVRSTTWMWERSIIALGCWSRGGLRIPDERFTETLLCHLSYTVEVGRGRPGDLRKPAIRRAHGIWRACPAWQGHSAALDPTPETEMVDDLGIEPRTFGFGGPVSSH